MMDILMFNTRELAIIFWVVVIVSSLCLYSSTRYSLVKLLETFFVKQIIFICLLVIVYTSIFISILYYYKLWDYSLLKTTLLWLIFVAFPTLFKVVRISEKEGYFKKAIAEDFKWTIILSFILGLITFSLWFEILLIPVAIFAGMLLAASGRDTKNEKLTHFLKGLVAYSSLLIVVIIVFQLISNYKDYLDLETLNDFLFPIIFSLAFMPFLYFFSLYLNYSTTFRVVSNFIDSSELCSFAKKKALLNFKFDKSGLKRWKQIIISGNVKTKTEVIEAIKKIKCLQIIEMKPPLIDINKGWSPYISKDFLKNAELTTGFYSSSFEDSWGTCSQYVKLDNEILANTIAYYIKGNENAVLSLKLMLNIYSPESALDGHIVLLDNAKTLYWKALSKELPKNIESAILFSEELDYNEPLAEIKITKNEWGNLTKGYTLTFEINHHSLLIITE